MKRHQGLLAVIVIALTISIGYNVLQDHNIQQVSLENQQLHDDKAD
jgi:predicted negative regulator of RcsB-dependent stress response